MIELGTHVYVNRTLYTHHGIWLGDDKVAHYTGEPGNLKNAEIAVTSLDAFLKGGQLKILDYPSPFSPAEIEARALLRIGEKRYGLLTNNCEHFAVWARLGTPRSLQVERGVDATTKFVATLLRPLAKPNCGKMSSNLPSSET